MLHESFDTNEAFNKNENKEILEIFYKEMKIKPKYTYLSSRLCFICYFSVGFWLNKCRLKLINSIKRKNYTKQFVAMNLQKENLF